MCTSVVPRVMKRPLEILPNISSPFGEECNIQPSSRPVDQSISSSRRDRGQASNLPNAARMHHLSHSEGDPGNEGENRGPQEQFVCPLSNEER